MYFNYDIGKGREFREMITVVVSWYFRCDERKTSCRREAWWDVLHDTKANMEH